MFMTRNSKGSELDRYDALAEEYKDVKMNFFQKFIVKTYLAYTKAQENESEDTTALIKKIDENNGEIPDKIANMYDEHVGLARSCNLLVFNFRSYILFALLIVDHFVATDCVDICSPYVCA